MGWYGSVRFLLHSHYHSWSHYGCANYLLHGYAGNVLLISGKAWLLLSSRIVLPLSILPLAVVNLLLLPFNHESSIYQLLVVVEGCYHQLHAQLIIQSFQKLLLLSCICSNVIWGITC